MIVGGFHADFHRLVILIEQESDLLEFHQFGLDGAAGRVGRLLRHGVLPPDVSDLHQPLAYHLASRGGPVYAVAMLESKPLDPGKVLIVVSGRLVMGKDIERLEAMVKELVAAGDAKVFVFDLSALDYADSSGIGTFVSCLTYIKKSGGEMRLAGANPRIQRLFTMTGVDHLMNQFPTVAAATA